MKRNVILVLIGLLSVTGIVSAEDLKEVGTGFSLVGGTHLDSRESGGYGEFGFALKRAPEGKGLELRNYIVIKGISNYSVSDNNGTVLGQYKFTFGGFRINPIVNRSYGFVAAGAGCGITSEGVGFIWETEFGGGTHIYLARNYLLAIEMGGGMRSMYGNPGGVNGYGFIRAGMGGIW